MRILTCIGDAASPTAWSGTPFHLFNAARRAGFLDAAWRLDPKRLRYHRTMWNAWSLVRHGESGGFQYSPQFLKRLLNQAASTGTDIEVISHFPLFPPQNYRGAVSYYIDATLAQNFEDYGLAETCTVSRHMMANAIAREKEHYAAAKHVVCMSTWAARSVVERYRISPSKVHVVPAGSNFNDQSCANPGSFIPPPLSNLRLGFLGKDWKRKNLSFVLDVAERLHARNIVVEVAAAGFPPEDGPRHHLLRPAGYIDKHSEPQRFLDFIQSCHFTCLFSAAEAFGISNRESLHLGVPVLARNTGGIPDTLPKDCGHLFAPHATADDVADVIAHYVDQPDLYEKIRANVIERRKTFAWDAAVEKLTAIWAGSQDYSYEKRSLADA